MYILKQSPFLVHFVVCLCHALLLTPTRCGFLASEFSEISTFQNKSSFLVHFVVRLCHALLLISIHCGFLGGESSEFSML